MSPPWNTNTEGKMVTLPWRKLSATTLTIMHLRLTLPTMEQVSVVWLLIQSTEMSSASFLWYSCQKCMACNWPWGNIDEIMLKKYWRTWGLQTDIWTGGSAWLEPVSELRGKTLWGWSQGLLRRNEMLLPQWWSVHRTTSWQPLMKIKWKRTSPFFPLQLYSLSPMP